MAENGYSQYYNASAAGGFDYSKYYNRSSHETLPKTPSSHNATQSPNVTNSQNTSNSDNDNSEVKHKAEKVWNEIRELFRDEIASLFNLTSVKAEKGYGHYYNASATGDFDYSEYMNRTLYPRQPKSINFANNTTVANLPNTANVDNVDNSGNTLNTNTLLDINLLS